MAKIKDRSEISDEFKWDLSAIYKDQKAFDNDYKKCEKLIEELPKYKDTMLNSGKDLLETTNKMLESSRIVENIYTYAHLKYSENISLPSSIELLDKATNLNIKYNQAISYYDSKLLSTEYNKIKEMYKDTKELEKMNTFFNKSFRYKEYMLTEEEEKLIANLQKTFQDNETVFCNLTDSDINFGTIVDEEGNTVELTNTNYSNYVKSKDRRVRKDAFVNLYRVYKRYRTTLAGLLEGKVKSTATFNKIRGYKSSLDAAMYSDELDTKVFNTLIESVSDGFKPLFKYFNIKKEILGLDEMHIYDTYASILDDYEKEYTYDEAKELIKETLSVLGDEYLSIIEKAFNEKWIDVMPNTGKTGGAFSGGGYDTYPYILSNFQGEFNDVSTLIHELGHSVHSYYTRTNNDYLYGNYSIVVAEVASTVNELLLALHVIKTTKDIKEKLYVLDRLMSLFKATIYRQTMYEEFEKFLYEKAEKEETLTSEVLETEFLRLNKKYFGEDIVIDDEIKYEWERMPHLYYNFYMYKYATGLSSACYIVNSILENKENAKENYIKFLKSGSTMAPNEELKLTGVDLTKKEVCDNAIKMFSSLVDEFEKTYKEYIKK